MVARVYVPRVTRSDIQTFARQILDALEMRGIISTEHFYEHFPAVIGDVRDRHVVLLKHRSPPLSQSDYLISYLTGGSPPLIETHLNPAHNRSGLFLRCDSQIEGYSPLSIDQARNILQVRALGHHDLGLLRNELVRLSSLSA